MILILIFFVVSSFKIINCTNSIEVNSNHFNSNYFNKIENTWVNKPLLECSKQCGKFDKLGAQFAN
jgi:hypothetical protein